MSLISSISGIRGTIGGKAGDGLSPIEIVKFTAAFATFIAEGKEKATIVVGRDARLSGDMVSRIVTGTLNAMGVDVIDIGLASTPTTEIAVTGEKADGGIIITASHNPINWNALKLLNSNGEFLSDQEGKKVMELAAAGSYKFAEVKELGHTFPNLTYNRKHIDQVLALKLVDKEAIQKAHFTVAVDAVNSVGGVVIPQLLRALGVENIMELNCELTGNFAHTPEPIPENLGQISALIKRGGIDVGFVVDPDVDRLAIVMENGEMFVEEYTLVAVADYVMSHTPGHAVSNLSSSRALKDVAERHGGSYSASAVGEVNVTTEMKRTNAIIGGEGNGGVIYPEAHYGRDALVGVALFLSLLAQKKMKVSELKDTYPQYAITKHKIQLTPETDIDALLKKVKEHYTAQGKITDIDGVKIDFQDGWVHLRRSNTEPIIRVYAEASTPERANELAQSVMSL